MAADSFLLGQSECDRCHTGLNDEYLEKKKGREERVAAFYKKCQDPANWCGCGALERFRIWLETPDGKPLLDKQ